MNTFEIWWSKNKELYGLVNVKKEVAYAIWSDAQNEISVRVLELIDENS
jgi:hypothetical protein